MVKSEILSYYDNLAAKYDEDRFGNTYGNYIHEQENQILSIYLQAPYKNIDLACGTGRFLHFAKTGLDISPNMTEVSKQKYPEKEVIIGDIENLQDVNSTYSNAYAFHLFMHLKNEQLESIFDEVHTIVKEKGLFIFDIPSKPRRQLFKYKSKGWHGSNSASPEIIKEALKSKWEIETYYGISFLPIHRIPKKWRRSFIWLDNLLSRSIFKVYASHLVFILKKV